MTWNRKSGRKAAIALLWGVLLAGTASGAEKPPVHNWIFTLYAQGEVRYDDNILSLSDQEIGRFENDAAYRNSSRFKINSVGSFILAPDVGLTFRHQPKRALQTSFGATLRAYEYLDNSVKSYQSYGFWAQQDLSKSRKHGTTLSAGFTRTPGYYLRELIDDDESQAAGMIVRNSLDYDLNNGYLEVGQEIFSRVLDVSVRYVLERRNYNDHFNERDSNSTIWVGQFDIFPLKRNVFLIRPYYAHEDRTSRGDIPLSPVVDDDVGFISDLYGLQLRGMWGPDSDHRRTVTVWYENEKRDFTSTFTPDVAHFGRTDDITQYWAGYGHEFSRRWHMDVAYRFRNNDSSTPSVLGGTTTTPFTKHVFYASLTYRFDNPQKGPARTEKPRPPREEDQR
jgi:hypothetical protein